MSSETFWDGLEGFAPVARKNWAIAKRGVPWLGRLPRRACARYGKT